MIKSLGIMVERKRCSLQQDVLSWADAHPLRYAWREPGTSAYCVLIGEMLLDRLKQGAEEAFERFVALLPQVSDLLSANEEKIGEVLAVIHLEQQRESFWKLVRGLAREGRGNLPCDTDNLGRISGLPRHGVKAVFCFGYGLPIAVVNTHVFRMLAHIFAADLPPQPPPGLVESVAEGLVCCDEPQKYNSMMLDLAELVCRAGMPECAICPVNNICDSVPSVQASVRSLARIG
jgi:A/G-specific adenine glycosylase